jgi:DDE superfamily endonuclease
LYISRTYKGKEHDYGLLKLEFPPQFQWFKRFTIRLDLGFQGFSDLYPCEKLFIPIKKKRVKKGESNELTNEQIETNRDQAKHRIVVEHSLAGLKRYKILVHRNRIKKKETIDKIIGVCAALWNYSLEA